MWKMLDLDFPRSIGGDATKQHEQRLKRWPSITLSGQITDELIQQTLWLGGSQHDKKEEIPWANSYRGTLNWRCGARKIEREGLEEWGERGRKPKVESQDDLLHTFTPPSAFSSVNSSESQRKNDGFTLRSHKNARREGTVFMPRLFKQYIHSCFDWFHVILNVLGCFNTIHDPTSLENVRCLESYGKFLFYLIGCQHDPPFESAPVAFIMQ